MLLKYYKCGRSADMDLILQKSVDRCGADIVETFVSAPLMLVYYSSFLTNSTPLNDLESVMASCCSMIWYLMKV